MEEDEEQIFDMVEFRKKQNEILRQEKWKNIEERIEVVKEKHYKIWKKKYLGGEEPGNSVLSDIRKIQAKDSEIMKFLVFRKENIKEI